MEYFEYFKEGFRKYAEFTGRATRKEFWMFMIFYTVIDLVLAIVDVTMGMVFFTAIYWVICLVPRISITVRRLHDTGRSAWWLLIILIPLLGLIVLLVFLLQHSREDNIYGSKPLQA
jgi:uncharacterized membrane protein YhaH (DUF805 family)